MRSFNDFLFVNICAKPCGTFEVGGVYNRRGKLVGKDEAMFTTDVRFLIFCTVEFLEGVRS
jgi:hypothetical protein